MIKNIDMGEKVLVRMKVFDNFLFLMGVDYLLILVSNKFNLSFNCDFFLFRKIFYNFSLV